MGKDKKGDFVDGAIKGKVEKVKYDPREWVGGMGSDPKEKRENKRKESKIHDPEAKWV